MLSYATVSGNLGMWLAVYNQCVLSFQGLSEKKQAFMSSSGTGTTTVSCKQQAEPEWRWSSISGQNNMLRLRPLFFKFVSKGCELTFDCFIMRTAFTGLKSHTKFWSRVNNDQNDLSAPRNTVVAYVFSCWNLFEAIKPDDKSYL